MADKTHKTDRNKIKCIAFGVIAICFIIWCMIGSNFITPDSSGAECFFLLTLPFLGAFAATFSCVASLLRRKLSKRKSEPEEKNAD